MRVAGRLAAEVLDYITPFVVPGVTTGELDRLCHDYMVDVQGCIPAPLIARMMRSSLASVSIVTPLYRVNANALRASISDTTITFGSFCFFAML